MSNHDNKAEQNPTTSELGDEIDKYVGDLVDVLVRPINPDDTETAYDDYDEKLKAAHEIARISLLDQVARTVLKKGFFDHGGVDDGVKALLQDAEDYNELGYDEQKEADQEEVINKLANDYLRISTHRKAAEYAKADQDVEVDPATGKVTKNKESEDNETSSASDRTIDEQKEEVVRGGSLKAMTKQDVMRILTKAGFERVKGRGKGSHAFYRHPDGRQTPVVEGRGGIPTGTRDSIFDRAGIIDPRTYL